MTIQNRVIAALCVMSLISCSRTDVAMTPATSAVSGHAGARPNTEVAAPLYDFGGHGGKDGTIGEVGGYGGLIGSTAALYGTTPGGGDVSCTWKYFTIVITGCGVVYKLTPKAGSSKYEETLLHVFKGPPDDGAGLFGSLFIGKNGEIYGTTYEGGKSNAGVVFKISASGSGYSVIHNFGGAPDDGAYPWGGIIEANGILYGVTTGGGTHKNSACNQFGFGSPEKSCGTLYSVNEATGAEKVLHDFGAGANDGINPLFPLTYVSGVIYGTTTLGLGTNATGTVFAVSPTTGKESILSTPGTYDFPNSPVTDINGILYGEAEHISGGPCCWGVVFSLDISSGSQQVLHNFQESTFDGGYFPSTGLTYLKGQLYGSTIDGGTSTECGSSSPRGCGTFFSLAPNGTGFSVLTSFSGGKGGEYPEDKPLYSGGSLYGTTILGGTQDDGTAFKIRLTH